MAGGRGILVSPGNGAPRTSPASQPLAPALGAGVGCAGGIRAPGEKKKDGQGWAQGTSTASWGLGGARNHGRPQVKCVAGGVRDENWRLTADTGGVKLGPRGAHISCVRGAGTRFCAQAGLCMRPWPHRAWPRVSRGHPDLSVLGGAGRRRMALSKSGRHDAHFGWSSVRIMGGEGSPLSSCWRRARDRTLPVSSPTEESVVGRTRKERRPHPARRGGGRLGRALREGDT